MELDLPPQTGNVGSFAVLSCGRKTNLAFFVCGPPKTLSHISSGITEFDENPLRLIPHHPIPMGLVARNLSVLLADWSPRTPTWRLPKAAPSTSPRLGVDSLIESGACV